MRRPTPRALLVCAGLSLLASSTVPLAAGGASAASARDAATAKTPIQHLVVIFQENVSFDHYFGTYPKAANTSGQAFSANHGTPKVNNLANTKGLGGVG